jgi:sigma-E factor negative regulatory protein RseC
MQVAGRVATVHEDRARVECAPGPSGCGACDTGRGCSWRRLGARFLEVSGRVDGQRLEPGDPVRLTIEDGALLRAATRIYLPPVTGTVLGAGLWQLVGAGSEAGALLAALAGFAAGHVAARRLARSVRPAVAVQRARGSA